MSLQACFVRLSVLPAVVAVGMLAFSASAYAETKTETFKYTGVQQTFTVPAGVTDVHVVATGGAGGTAPAGGAPGGRGAVVSANVAVTSGTLYVEVGGAGAGATGGFNGGGGEVPGAYGGGGGGASDVRTISSSAPKTLESRLLVAAGGGGGGSENVCAGGPGGDAEKGGASGSSCGWPAPTGGGPGTAMSGGATGTNCCYPALNGEPGVLGQGGTGTTGGGGGGGKYGGGSGGFGGGSGSISEVAGSGGGGGGSNLVPAGGTAVLDENGAAPSVVITYTVPPSIDGEASAQNVTSATASLTTKTAGDLIVAFAASGSPITAGSTSSTVSGGGLTWTLAGRENAAVGDSEVWTAKASGVLSSAPITATTAKSGYEQTIDVIAFKNSTKIGTVAKFTSNKGAPTGHLKTTNVSGWVFAVGDDG